MIGTAGLVTMGIGYGMFFMHLALVWMLVLYFVFPETWKSFKKIITPYALMSGAIIGCVGILFSLYYSQIVGLPVCPLCWWQRIALYPIALMFTIAWWKNDRKIFLYVLPLAIIGALFAMYHEWLQVGGHSLIPCSADPGESPCAKVYFKELGYITFPVLALTVFVYYSLLAFLARDEVSK